MIKMSMGIVVNMVLSLKGINHMNSCDELMSWILSREAMLHIVDLWTTLFSLWDDKKEVDTVIQNIKTVFGINCKNSRKNDSF